MLTASARNRKPPLSFTARMNLWWSEKRPRKHQSWSGETDLWQGKFFCYFAIAGLQDFAHLSSACHLWLQKEKSIATSSFTLYGDQEIIRAKKSDSLFSDRERFTLSYFAKRTTKSRFISSCFTNSEKSNLLHKRAKRKPLRCKQFAWICN